MNEPTPDRGDVWDDYQRVREYDYAEHRAAIEESERELLRAHGGDPKPARRVKRRDSTARSVHPTIAWKLTVLERDMGCCVHGNPADCAEGWQAHHVVAQQVLRRSCPAIVWHPLSGMGVCGLAHRQHHSRVRPILLDEIPVAVVIFLREQGFAAYLGRHYPERLVEW